MADSNLSFVPTRCSSLKNIAVQYQEVVFENPSKKKIKSNRVDTITVANKELPNSLSNFNNSVQEFDMKHAKYELKKFAKCNAKSLNRQKTYRELAIELGARPYRRDSIHYKELLAKKKKQKIKDQKKLDKVLDGKVLNKPLKKKSKPENKNRSGLLHIYGKAKLQNSANDVHQKNKRGFKSRGPSSQGFSV